MATCSRPWMSCRAWKWTWTRDIREQERSGQEAFEGRGGTAYLCGAKPPIHSQLRGALPKRGKDSLWLCRVSCQSGRQQTDGKTSADGMESAWSTSSAPDPNACAQRRVGRYFPKMVPGLPSKSRCEGQQRGLTPGIFRSPTPGSNPMKEL